MRVPLATYRLQLHAAFPLPAAREIVPYLRRLGVSHLYLSPLLKARRGSSHGYDVVDPTVINPELGGEPELRRLEQALEEAGMGLLLDIVPNHMAFSGENRLLVDLLENGPDSSYFATFDVEWNHPYESMKGRLLAPFLGDFYGTCLERGEIRLSYDREGFAVLYYELSLPLRMDSYSTVLTHRQAELRRALGRDHPDYLKYLGVLYTLRHLAPGVQAQERYDQIAFAKAMLWELYSQSPEIHGFIDENVHSFDGRPEEPASFDALDSLLSQQFFRLSFWKVGTEELNYRRFFNLNELICLCTEERKVLNETHALIFELAADREEVGLRVDHVDGLYDPLEYLRRLRERLPETYLVVEKILEHPEELPEAWPVQGTTGYDFLNLAGGLFCNRRNRASFGRIYRRFAGREVHFTRLLYEKKRLIVDKHMVGDVDNLAHLLKRLASRYRYGSDYTLYGFKRALTEAMAFFPIYRSYISPEGATAADQGAIREAIRRAKEVAPDFVHELDFIEKIFGLHFEEELDPEGRQGWYRFIQRFQQFTGPLMAKGLEDTALYVYDRLLSLNEVGGNPDRFGASLIEFHHFNRRRSRMWPWSLNATSTHDSKRGEDVRARLSVLSEIPQEWDQAVGSWSRVNRGRKPRGPQGEIPDRNDEYFLYQTLLGAWPFRAAELDELPRRLEAYLIKAVREAKVHTAWLAPDSTYEEGFLGFLRAVLDREGRENPFLDSFLPFQRKVAWYGALNSLSQTLLKIASPGVPDFYQGAELWDLNLVDPDNRRPVDYRRRAELLQEIEEGEAAGVPKLLRRLFAGMETGAVKLFLIRRALGARARERALFEGGAYQPLEARGRLRHHLVAFARGPREGRWALAAVPRFFTALAGEGELPLGPSLWADTWVAAPAAVAVWENALTGEKVPGGAALPAAALFASFPGALLVGTQG